MIYKYHFTSSNRTPLSYGFEILNGIPTFIKYSPVKILPSAKQEDLLSLLSSLTLYFLCGIKPFRLLQ